MIRRPSPKSCSTAIPSRVEVAAALTAAGLLTSSAAFATPGDPAQGAPAQSAPTSTAAPAATPDTEEYEGWFPPEKKAPKAAEGTLFIDQLPPEATVAVDGADVPRDKAAQGVVLPAGKHQVHFRSACGTPYVREVDIEDGAVMHIDALSLIGPGQEMVMGGAPPQEHFEISGGGCCGGARASSASNNGPSGTVLAGLIVAMFGVRRRRR